MIILNLGCGASGLEHLGLPKIGIEIVGIDIRKTPIVSLISDINYPLPIRHGSMDRVYCYDIIEHLDDILSFMEEVGKVLVPNGLLFIRVPAWDKKVTWDDPTHKRGYTENSFDLWDTSTFKGSKYTHCTDHKFKVLKVSRVDDDTNIHYILRKVV